MNPLTDREYAARLRRIVLSLRALHDQRPDFIHGLLSHADELEATADRVAPVKLIPTVPSSEAEHISNITLLLEDERGLIAGCKCCHTLYRTVEDDIPEIKKLVSNGWHLYPCKTLYNVIQEGSHAA